MKKLTKMVETTYAYEAVDGMIFDTEEECRKYEKTAYTVAAGTAKFYEVRTTVDECLWPGVCGSEDRWVVYRVPDVKALNAINTYLELREAGNHHIDPKYIGSEVIVQFYEWDSGYYVHGSQEDLIAEATKAVRYLFHGAEVTEA